jgi:hypothetical protein
MLTVQMFSFIDVNWVSGIRQATWVAAKVTSRIISFFFAIGAKVDRKGHTETSSSCQITKANEPKLVKVSHMSMSVSTVALIIHKCAANGEKSY